MIKKAGHIFTFFLLTAMLLLSTTPREFVHDLVCNHQDTIDQPHHEAKGKMSFEPEHHHCDFVQYAFSVFNYSQPTFCLHFFPKTEVRFSEKVFSLIHSQLTTLSARGPPALQFLS